MKRIYSSIVTIGAALLFAACANELEKDVEIRESDAPVIYACQEAPSKSSISVDGEGVGTIYWSPADEISVFYGASSPVLYTSTNTAPETTAAFTTTAVIGSTELASTNIWGLYPHDPAATCSGTSVTTTLPATQYGVSGTFDDDLFLTLAHSDDTNLHFYNVCGGIKFSLSRDDITSITFRGNNNEDIAGDISLTFEEGLPKATVTSGLKEITLTPKTGSTFVSGENYYLILLPVTLSNGFTMTFETATEIGTFNYTAKAVTIKRSIFSKKNEIDGYATFEEKSNITNLSASGTANCYIVPASGTYKFAAVQGNSNTSVGNIKGVKVLWESYGNRETVEVGDIINPAVLYSNGYISFSTNDTFREGNAVIAAYSDVGCTDGNVLWSWHLWLTSADIDGLCQTYNNGVGDLMDRNLGAQNNINSSQTGNQGLLYQWGRKDPFLSGYGYGGSDSNDNLLEATSSSEWPAPVASDEITGTIAYATAHPTTFITNNSDWLKEGADLECSRWGITKTIYDPCPVGYKVPQLETWIIAYGKDYDIYNFYSPYIGSQFSAGSLSGSVVWFPAGKMRNGGTGSYQLFSDRMTVYWGSNAPNGAAYTRDQGPSMYLQTNDRIVYLYRPQGHFRWPWTTYKSVGAMIRCARESNPTVIRPESTEISETEIIVEPGGQKQLNASILPANSNITSIRWSSNNTSIATVSNSGLVSGVAMGKTKVYAGSSFWQNRSLDYYSGSTYCDVNVCPLEPTSGMYGGWYIQAKAGDTISFHYDIGDGESGDNSILIYWKGTRIHSNYGSNFDGDFSYTFPDDYSGWLYMTWGWCCSLSNVTTTATVLGWGNNDFNNYELSFGDNWMSTPSYVFRYDNHKVTFN